MTLTEIDDVKVRSNNPDILGSFFSEFLDEVAFSEFRRVERMIRSIRRQGSTVSGYPVIRPSDCAQIAAQLESIFDRVKSQLRTHDNEIASRFDALVTELWHFVSTVYAGEAMSVRILHARVKLFMGDSKGALGLVSHHALRPYLVEGGPFQWAKLIDIFGQAHLQEGTLQSTGISFLAVGSWLSAVHPTLSPGRVGVLMAPFVALGKKSNRENLIHGVIRHSSARLLASTNGRGTAFRRVIAYASAIIQQVLLGRSYALLSRKANRCSPFQLKMNLKGRALVTRAMGGIGDLLMMEPGLAALAARQKAPVDFAIPLKFHPIFQHNPNIRLIDIEGPAIEIASYRYWINLTNCPAGRYESKNRPNVKKGRVQIFAKDMGISHAKLLTENRGKIQFYASEEDREFCEEFIRERGIGRRPLVGVQPYSRDSYKDHVHIAEIIRILSLRYDVLIFHHLNDGLPSGAGIWSTAGLPLGKSLALVSRLDAMVSVDSAFLHAAAAFDVPVVAMFGPTDGRTFTQHHSKVKILWKQQEFGCMPCWRNEDLPCVVSKLRTASPCISAISPDEIVVALEEVLAKYGQSAISNPAPGSHTQFAIS